MCCFLKTVLNARRENTGPQVTNTRRGGALTERQERAVLLRKKARKCTTWASDSSFGTLLPQ